MSRNDTNAPTHTYTHAHLQQFPGQRCEDDGSPCLKSGLRQRDRSVQAVSHNALPNNYTTQLMWLLPHGKGFGLCELSARALSFGPHGSRNYSFAWSLGRSVSRQPVKDAQGQANIYPTAHQPITVNYNNTRINATATKAAEGHDKMGWIQIFGILRGGKRGLVTQVNM